MSGEGCSILGGGGPGKVPRCVARFGPVFLDLHERAPFGFASHVVDENVVEGSASLLL